MSQKPGRLEEGYVPKGVYIITTRSREVRGGMTASWVCRVATRPPTMMVAIHEGSHTGGLIRESGAFAINLIDGGQVELARHFGLTSGHRVDKFKDLDTLDSGSGQPVLAQAFGYIDCRVMDQAVVGDHTVFFGEIIEERLLRNGQALMFQKGDYWKEGKG
jgi:flavin reductase (DIM6/NTAB) family NADH-FMN oxidoreductase RutF